MDPKKITDLANLFRDNGDKVLTSEFKLTLTGSLLRALNDSFTLIADTPELGSTQTFQVVKPNNSKSNVFRDLQLVHDFVQKTVSLCITHYPGDDYFDGVIDISKFRSLQRLEIQKTNVKQIIGIQPLRSQLQQLVCTRSLKDMTDIITHCGGDNSNGFVWNELKVIDFSYNRLLVISDSLKFAQYLQHLKLQHNDLDSVPAIKYLPNLKSLDLSFNCLTEVPSLHMQSSKSLQVLNLSNNFIQNINGLSMPDQLTDLDLSHNCLLDHYMLFPLSFVMSLKYLNLYGNPLYCHPKHRLATAQFLHKNTSTVNFILDNKPMSKNEKLLTGTHQSRRALGFFLRRGDPPSFGQQTATSQTPSSSVNSFQLNGDDEGIDMSSSITEKSQRSKTRTVIIENSSKEQQSTTLQEDFNFLMLCNREHLETKKQIEVLRKKYGAGWLQNDTAQMIYNTLGLSPSKVPADNPDSKLTAHQIFDDYLGEMNISRVKGGDDVTVITSTPTDDSALEPSQSEIDQSTVYSTAEENLSDMDQKKKTMFETANEETVDTDSEEKQQDIAPHLSGIYGDTTDVQEFSDPEEDEETYVVFKGDESEVIFITVSPNYIREKDTLNQRTMTKWSLKILESCDRIKSNTLRINFDTIKQNKRERVYTVEEGLCQQLENRLRAILSKRDLLEMNQKIYRCVNCSCQFSQEITHNTYRKRDVICPDCKSTFVAEIHSVPKSLEKAPLTPPNTPPTVVAIEAGESVANPPTVDDKEKRESSGERDSSQQSSIGKGPSRLTAINKLSRSLMQSLNQSSATSLNESSSCSKISHSQSSFESNQSVAGSSAVDRENDFKSNCESDVDILSNPSQSSIEVLDQRESESPDLNEIDEYLSSAVDQSDFMMPQGMPSKSVPEVDKKTLLGQVQLTESSSSGSVADSVCTTYDQGANTPIKNQIEVDDGSKKPPTEESNKKEESMLSSMFGGLLQSTNILMSRTSQRFIESESSPVKCDKYKFNYTDFSDVDHRLKFYFYNTRFQEKDEHFKWIVKGKIYNENAGALTDGIVVMSTVKCYVMEAYAVENETVIKWLRPIVSVTVDRLESIHLLPWKTGLAFSLRDWGGFLLLLQDILRTDSLLLYFTKNALPSQCELNYQPSEKVLSRLSNAIGDEQLTMFSLLNACEVKSDSPIQNYSLSSLLVTSSHVYLTASNISWLTPQSDVSIELNLTQSMSNVVDVERLEDNIIAINFLDETQDKSEIWKCTFETKENAESCLNAIGQSWEKLFGVPLFSN